MEQDNRVIDDIAAAKIKLLLEAERNAANTMPPGLASNNSGGSTLANLLNPSLFRGGPAARGMAGRVLRPGIEAEDSLLNRTMSGPGQVARNLGGSVLAGLLGTPGDLNAMFPKPLQGALPLPTSEQLQDKFGVEANRPESFVGLVGAPDPMDLARAGGKGLLAMTLFHGTPHKFDRFALDKIGTGEGAQAYGHGLYFAENPGVARSYQSDLADTVKFDGIDIDVNSLSMDDPVRQAVSSLRGRSGDKDAAIRGLREWADSVEDGSTHRAAADWIEQNKDRIDAGGHLYEVDIPDETVDKMLDWDAPLSEQPEIARKAVEKAIADSPIKNRGRGLNIEFSKWAYDKGLDAQKPTQEMLSRYKAETGVEPHLWKQNNPDPTGQEIYNWMRLQNDTAEGASNALNEAGIPGIRYFDGQSRVTGIPRKKVISNFLDELPEDAEFDEVMELVGTGHFSKAQDDVLRALDADDWLGFDYPSQAINEAFGPNLVSNFDPSPKLVKAISNTVEPDATRNIVVFNPDDITSVKRDGELVWENRLGVKGEGPRQ